MACRLVSAKPLPEPVSDLLAIKHQQMNIVKFGSKHISSRTIPRVNVVKSMRKVDGLVDNMV